MSLLDAIYRRRSIRRYQDKQIPQEILEKILEAGRTAPSANNMQPWHFIIVTDQKLKQKLSQGNWNTFIKESAFTIVGCGDKNNEWSTIDVTIALENMVIAAEAQGVSSCWVGDFIEEDLKKTLNIPKDLKVICQISFGYSAEKPSPRRTKKLEEIIHYNQF